MLPRYLCHETRWPSIQLAWTLPPQRHLDPHGPTPIQILFFKISLILSMNKGKNIEVCQIIFEILLYCQEILLLIRLRQVIHCYQKWNLELTYMTICSVTKKDDVIDLFHHRERYPLSVCHWHNRSYPVLFSSHFTAIEPGNCLPT